MTDITKKTIAMLIDELCTTSQRCWNAQEDLMNTDLPNDKRLSAAIKAQEANARRNQLMRAIDSYFGETNSPSEKTYK
jgi:hypothetical protein